MYVYYYIRMISVEFFSYVTENYLRCKDAPKLIKLVKQFYLNDTYWSYKEEVLIFNYNFLIKHNSKNLFVPFHIINICGKL